MKPLNLRQHTDRRTNRSNHAISKNKREQIVHSSENSCYDPMNRETTYATHQYIQHHQIY